MNVKGKLVAGVVTVGLVSGIGMAFANTDAGGALKNWYDAQFNKTVESVQRDVGAYTQGKIPGLLDEYNTKKAAGLTEISQTGDSELESSSSAIEVAKNSHIESLEGSKEEILGQMGQQFYQDVFLEGFYKIQQASNEAFNYANRDLSTQTGNAGTEAINSVTTGLTDAKERAVSELEEAIRLAKEELSASLDTAEEYTTRNLKNQVDWHIGDLREQVENILDTLVAEQQALIVAKADELEEDAKASLDTLVSGINN